MRNRKYSEEYKAEAVQLVLSRGLSVQKTGLLWHVG